MGIYGKIIDLQKLLQAWEHVKKNRPACGVDHDSQSLRARLKQLLPKELTLRFFANDRRFPKTGFMVWKEESVYNPQGTLGIGTQDSPYLGTALPLAFVAAKYDFPKVHIVPKKNGGDEDYVGNALHGNKEAVLRYMDREIDFSSIIRCSPDASMEAKEDRNMKTLVIYDEDYNFLNALWKWFKYAGSSGTLLHVVSPFYMMREFFSANIHKKSLLYANNADDAIFPGGTVLRRTLLASILATLADTGMTEEELIAFSDKYDLGYLDIALLLRDAILTVRKETEFHSVYDHFLFRKEDYFAGSDRGIVHLVRIQLSDGQLNENLRSQLSLAKLSYKKNEYLTLPILGGNIRNYYLPKQVFSHSGSFYTVTGIENGVLYAEPTHPSSMKEYHEICDFSLSGYHLLDHCVDSPVLDLNICAAKAVKTIYGYIATVNGNDFSEESMPQVNLVNDKEGRPVLTSAVEDVPILELNFRRNAFVSKEKDSSEPAILLLSVLLRGILRTFFPNAYQNLAVVPDFAPDDVLIDRVMNHVLGIPAEDLIRATIPRVRADAESRPEYLRIYIIEYSCIEYGMVRAIYDHHEMILGRIYEYLDWYLVSNQNASEIETNEGKSIICGRYLHFGLEEIPKIFAPESLRVVLKHTLMRRDSQDAFADTMPEEEASGKFETTVCSFCGREIIFGWRLSDGRCMCSHCHDHQATQREEINKLFLETREMLEKHYRLEFRKDIHVRFQSADAIRKAAKAEGNARVVGFYNHAKSQLWIESRGPRVAIVAAVIHELTHAWQHDALPLRELGRHFPMETGKKRMELLLEGHAVYVEIEAMRENGEEAYARRLRARYLSENDVYGLGYRLLYDVFAEMKNQGSHMNAFACMKKLMEDLLSNKGEGISWPEGY